MQDINDTIRDNIGLIMKELNKFGLRRDQEAESIGYSALYRAAETYEEERGYAFSTYATCCVRNALGSYVRTLNRKRQLEVISYNNIAYEEDGVRHEFVDFLAAKEKTPDNLLQKELCSKVKEKYELVYSRLTNERHKLIVKTWYESECSLSNKSIAEVAGCSQPYVNQVINAFKHKLRKELEEYYYA